MPRPLLLASASPRRAELLRDAGFAFEVLAADVDETPTPGESADGLVQRLARLKARAIADMRPGHLVLGADTTVCLDGDIFGKPADEADACRMLQRLSGRVHEVLTGVALVSGSREAIACERTDVTFATLTPDEVAWYVRSGEPMDKAGAYGVQGLASRFVTGLRGSYANVVGLPVARVYEMLREFDREAL